jgi:hypothetical protein
MDVAVWSRVYNWVVRKSIFSTYTVATANIFNNSYFLILVYDRKDFEKFPLLTISDFLPK